ncbi:glycogen synthase [Gaiella sp.]|uniref:glycogen synthase n=1 Tax=Gaiella sp. TaxID=2663207 RepID=UPI003263C5CD
MRVALLTREYPPEVYGGAGVHVEYLARELARVADVTVHCWGAERSAVPGGPAVAAYRPWDALAGTDPSAAALQAFSIDLSMAAGVAGADLVHSHTWYANLGGHLAKLVHGVPHVATVHSLEPMRPWKREQLGGGYELSSFAERTALESADAIIAVSTAHLEEILACYPAIDPARTSVIYNGIDSNEYRPDGATDVLERHGIDPARPTVLFVGRITRQKGLIHLLDAAAAIDPEAQLVLCAGAPDTPEIAAEIAMRLEGVRSARSGVVWIEQMLPKPDVIQLLTHATVFACPSIYEPMGIVNLEAMACETAVVATAVGGIPEVVEDGVTGLLVSYEAEEGGTGTPVDPARMAADLAARINELLADRARATALGLAGRVRAIEHFGWDVAARRTLGLYERLVP